MLASCRHDQSQEMPITVLHRIPMQQGPSRRLALWLGTRALESPRHINSPQLPALGDYEGMPCHLISYFLFELQDATSNKYTLAKCFKTIYLYCISNAF